MTTPALLFDTESQTVDDMNCQGSDVPVSHSTHSDNVRRSALWAAYGDALGWISELTDEAGLQRRTDGAPLDRPVAWKRRIGGRSGITASLPVGCYSDDTQLRLATGRAIRPDGFDVEAFANVELPIWLSYELGGGRGTKAAASNLAKSRMSWFANTFNGWTESGGNGAAMRIQPHVWASCVPDNPETILPDVIRNAICTHSHPTGMMGATLHALALAHTIANGRSPAPDDMNAIIEIAANVPVLMQNDFEVWNYWRTAFERESGSFGKAWERAVADSRDALRAVGIDVSNLTGAEKYSTIIDKLMLREPQNLGNGILTAMAAISLTWCESSPEGAMLIAANAIGTDTDTIATMAGAIVGITAETEPPIDVMDADLIRSEATRLSMIAEGGHPNSHQYPDLLHWSAPKTRSDVLMRVDSRNLYVNGLGLAAAISEPITAPNGNFMWQWLKLESGQTVLLKRRNALLQCDQDLRSLRALRAPHSDGDSDKQKLLTSNDGLERAVNTDSPQPAPKQLPGTSKRPIDLQGALNYIQNHEYDDRAIGYALRGVVARGTPGEIAAFTAALIDRLRESEATKAKEQPSSR